MGWADLGTLRPSLDWQDFPIPVIGGETFRVQQSYSLGLVTARLVFGCLYPSSGRQFGRRLYPSLEDQIFTFPVPEDLQSAGEFVRYLSVRHNLYGRVYEQDNWQVSLQVFDPNF
ncbi:MAG: hypothetical protein ICV77_09755 [Cyanobacteria bacterium Co-bin8]|nr:hypothetical protein [Cyanobacteria bacterium Co-bin8]